MESEDRMIEVRLYSPHQCDFIYQRPDNSYYALRQDKKRYIVELEKDGNSWKLKA